MIIAISFYLAFAAGKPCCNKKVGNKAFSCKFNHSAIETDRDITGEITAGDSEDTQKTFKYNNNCGSQCAISVTKKTGGNFGQKNPFALVNKLPLSLWE